MLLLLLLTNAFVLLPWAGAGRIIGGREAVPHSRPYMAYLKIKNETNTTACGGFLIRPDAVLSAAHCVCNKGRIVSVTVTLGAHNIKKREPSQQKIPVGKWVIHPQYSRKGFKNDIMLLKLKKKAKINEKVQYISIAKENERVRVGDLCTVSGWGWTSLKPLGSDVLREVDLEVQKEEICQKVFDNYQRQSMICVGDENHKKSTYKAFTRLLYFEPWIREQLRRFALHDNPGFPFSD
ncbi:cathepsin G-like [Geothlypis trichas]